VKVAERPNAAAHISCPSSPPPVFHCQDRRSAALPHASSNAGAGPVRLDIENCDAEGSVRTRSPSRAAALECWCFEAGTPTSSGGGPAITRRLAQAGARLGRAAGPPVRRRRTNACAATATGSWSICSQDCQFFGNEALDGVGLLTDREGCRAHAAARHSGRRSMAQGRRSQAMPSCLRDARRCRGHRRPPASVAHMSTPVAGVLTIRYKGYSE
jgi:hypothetical protein